MDVVNTLLGQGYSYEQLFNMGFLSVAKPDNGTPSMPPVDTDDTNAVPSASEETNPAQTESAQTATESTQTASGDVLDAIAALGAEVKALMQAINRNAAIRPSVEPQQMSLDDAIRGIYSDKK